MFLCLGGARDVLRPPTPQALAGEFAFQRRVVRREPALREVAGPQGENAHPTGSAFASRQNPSCRRWSRLPASTLATNQFTDWYRQHPRHFGIVCANSAYLRAEPLGNWFVEIFYSRLSPSEPPLVRYG